MLSSADGLACIACGHQDYGPDFKPHTLTVADVGVSSERRQKVSAAYVPGIVATTT
jgi:hypothetical protein